MKIIKKNLSTSIKILTGAIAFCFTILLGALLNSDPAKLFWGAILSWFIFSLLGWLIALIVERLFYETEDMSTSEIATSGTVVDVYQPMQIPEIGE